MSEPAFIERSPRVRFKHPVRVVPMDGGMPRAYRVLSANLSKEGMFLKMPNPPEVGTVVALSLEAGGRVLPFAQATVMWRLCQEAHGKPMGGFGVKFQNYLHPRSEELVTYLVEHLDTGAPLTLLGRATSWTKLAVAATLVLLAGLGAATYFLLGPPAARAEAALTAPPLVAVEAAPEAAAQKVETVAALPDRPEPAPLVEAAPVPAAAVAPSEPVAEAAPPPAPEELAAAPAEPVQAAPVKAEPAKPEPVKVEAKPAAVAEATPNEKLEHAGPKQKPVAARATAAAAVHEPKSNGVGEAGMELPSGAATSMEWTESPKQMAVFMRLKDGARLVQAYRLGSPNRVVIELAGAAPDRSYTLRSPAITFNRVRIGRHGATTHIVLDLKKPASRVMKHGHTLTVTF